MTNTKHIHGGEKRIKTKVKGKTQDSNPQKAIEDYLSYFIKKGCLN